MFFRLAASAILALALMSAVHADPASPTGKWLAEDIDGGGVIDRLQTTLELNADGIVTGTGGCNRYAGSANIDGNTITFRPMASTRMACSAAAMNQEYKFHRALENVKGWRVDQPRRKLMLLDKSGFDLMRFSRME